MHLADQRFVQKPLGTGQRLVHMAADQIQLRERSVARLQRHVDPHPAGLRLQDRCRCQHPKLVDAGAEPLAADVHFRIAVVERLHHPLEPERADQDAVADRRQAIGLPRAAAVGDRLRLAAQPLADGVDRRPRLGARRTGLPGRNQPRRHAALGFGGQRLGLDLEPGDDGLDLAARIAQPLFDALLEPAPEGFLAVAQLLLPRLQPRGRLFQRLPLACRQAVLVLESPAARARLWRGVRPAAISRARPIAPAPAR